MNHDREPTIRVVVADDQAMIRAGLRMILDNEADLAVVAEAADGLAAVDAALSARPDVVLMDVRMPLLDGLEATRRIVASSDAPPGCWSSPPSTTTSTSATPCAPEPAASCSKMSGPTR